MIFLGNNNSKIFILALMVPAAAVFIFYKYLESDPFPKVADNNQTLWTQISDGTEDDFKEIKNNIELGVEEVKGLGEEIKKENDRQALLEQTKEYVENKLSSSTASSSPEENQ